VYLRSRARRGPLGSYNLSNELRIRKTGRPLVANDHWTRYRPRTQTYRRQDQLVREPPLPGADAETSKNLRATSSRKPRVNPVVEHSAS
jgi:hypothetical protein